MARALCLLLNSYATEDMTEAGRGFGESGCDDVREELSGGRFIHGAD